MHKRATSTNAPPGQNPGLQEDSFHGPGLELPASGTLAAGFDGEAVTVSAFRVDSGQAGALPVHENLHDAAIDEDSQLEWLTLMVVEENKLSEFNLQYQEMHHLVVKLVISLLNELEVSANGP